MRMRAERYPEADYFVNALDSAMRSLEPFGCIALRSPREDPPIHDSVFENLIDNELSSSRCEGASPMLVHDTMPGPVDEMAPL